MSKPNLSSNRLRLESLERRLMLDGNVMLEVVDGNLILRGDHEANWIDIQPYQPIAGGETDAPDIGPSRYQYVVAGREDTTINGEKEVKVRGVTGDIHIALGRGDDSVNLHGAPQIVTRERDAAADGEDGPMLPGPGFVAVTPLSVPADLTIRGSRGNDRVTLDAVRVGENLRIHTAAGDDNVSMAGVQVGGNLAIATGRGEDFVTIRAAYPTIMMGDPSATDAVLEMPSSFVGGRARINTGPRADHVMVQNTTIGGDLLVGTSLGDDTLLLTESTVRGNTVLNTSFGNDSVGVSRTTVGNRFVLNTGWGNDIVGRQRVETSTTGEHDMMPEVLPPLGIIGLKAKSAIVNTGWGSDYVELVATSVARRLTVRLGGGEDRLRAVDNVVEGFAYLDGGFGRDLVNENVKEVNKFAQSRIVRFENLRPTTNPTDPSEPSGPRRPGGRLGPARFARMR